MSNVAVWIKQKLSGMNGFVGAVGASGELPRGREARLPLGRGRLEVLSTLLSHYSRSDASAESLLAEKIFQVELPSDIDQYEARWFDRLRDLAMLRALAFGTLQRGKAGLRQGFAFAETPMPAPASERDRDAAGDAPALQDVMESAMAVAGLYWKLYRACTGEFPELKKVAIRLYEALFQVPYEEASARDRISRLVDSMQRDHGVPFLILNLMRQGRDRSAREVSHLLLLGESQLDEEILSPLYWMSELVAFTQDPSRPLADYDATVRHLYHLCFTNPDRGGFLEIDSPFYSEFDSISEMAREAFVFRETLVDWVLALWKDYEGVNDGVFLHVLQIMARRHNKIHDSRESWEIFWRQERPAFSRDYLSVTEGNLAFAAGAYADALACYERALELNPSLRSAKLNRVFCAAQLGDTDRHEAWADEIAHDADLGPSGLYVAGNSFLLAGRRAESDAYYRGLAELDGWRDKTEYYRSTFCLAHRRHEEAVHFAELAAERTPGDPAVHYHLSVCYNAMGDTGRALGALNQMRDRADAEWIEYYRFTLERDAGETEEAARTLRRIPREYFQDPLELEEALRFARRQQDLDLLRHLKPRR